MSADKLLSESDRTIGDAHVSHRMDPREVHDNGKPVFIYRRVDPPAAPYVCPTCGSADREFRNLGCNGSYGILHDNCGTDPCPDAWHTGPAAPDERDKALAEEILDKWDFGLTENESKPLETLITTALATVRAEADLPPHKAINFLTALEHQVHRNHEFHPSECGECAMTEQIASKLREQLGLQSARTGKVEG